MEELTEDEQLRLAIERSLADSRSSAPDACIAAAVTPAVAAPPAEDEQLRLAIERSLADMQICTPAAGDCAAVVEAAATAATAAPAAAAPAAIVKPKKYGKKRILRVLHADGIHRMKKFDFDTETVSMLRQRIIRSMELGQISPEQVIIKLDPTGVGPVIGNSDDHRPLPDVGIDKNGQKIWVEFPREKLPALAPYLGTRFLRGKGTCGPESLQAAKVIGIYFSAHWCGPCRSFTPQLVATYNNLNMANAPVEIIFVSCDRDESSMQSYFATMPWLAFPLRDDRGSVLNDKFGVRGIPTLVFVDTSGKVLTTSGRNLISEDPSGQKVLRLAR